MLKVIVSYFNLVGDLQESKNVLKGYVDNSSKQKIEHIRKNALEQISKARESAHKINGLKLDHKYLVQVLEWVTFKKGSSACKDNAKLIKTLESRLFPKPNHKFTHVPAPMPPQNHKISPNESKPAAVKPKPSYKNPGMAEEQKTSPFILNNTLKTGSSRGKVFKSETLLSRDTEGAKTTEEEIADYMGIYNDEKLGKLKFRGQGEFIIRESSMQREKYPENAKQAYSLDINDGVIITPHRFFLMNDGTLSKYIGAFKEKEFHCLKDLLDHHNKFEKTNPEWISLEEPITANENIEAALLAEAEHTANTQDPVFYNNSKEYPFVPFNPLYILDGSGFDFLAEETKNNPIPDGLKIYLDHARKLAFIGHGIPEIYKLAPDYSPLMTVIGSIRYPVFDGNGPGHPFKFGSSRYPILTPINPDYVFTLLRKAEVSFSLCKAADPRLKLPEVHCHRELVEENA